MTDRPSWGLRRGDPIGPGRTVIESLGGGKRTEVLLAQDEAVGGLVVVKVLRPESSRGAERAMRVEADLVGALDHPVFPRLIDARLDEEPAHTVLEHVTGPRLSTHVRTEGALDVHRLTSLAVELADGLSYLHGEGYVHLDVKPSNTILSDSWRLIDLGIARSFERAKATTGIVGTHRFQSPEQHYPEAFGGLTPAADVWGLGTTLMFAAAGSSPFGPLRDEHDQRRKLTREDVDHVHIPGHLPAHLVQIIRGCLEWDPRARPTPYDIVHDLKRVARPRRRLLGWRRGEDVPG